MTGSGSSKHGRAQRADFGDVQRHIELVAGGGVGESRARRTSELPPASARCRWVQNSIYNITDHKQWPVGGEQCTVLTDTYASAGLALVSVTPSAGTPARRRRPRSPATSGQSCQRSDRDDRGESVDHDGGILSNTASITDSGTPPDPNTGNNTYRRAGAGGERGVFRHYAHRGWNSERSDEHVLSGNCERCQRSDFDSRGHGDGGGRHDCERQPAAGDPDAGCQHQHHQHA